MWKEPLTWPLSPPFLFLEAFSAPVFTSGPDRNGFNVGLRKNLHQVFGEDVRLWFIPVFTGWVCCQKKEANMPVNLPVQFCNRPKLCCRTQKWHNTTPKHRNITLKYQNTGDVDGSLMGNMMLTAEFKVVLHVLALKLMNKMSSRGLKSSNGLESLTNLNFLLYLLCQPREWPLLPFEESEFGIP